MYCYLSASIGAALAFFRWPSNRNLTSPPLIPELAVIISFGFSLLLCLLTLACPLGVAPPTIFSSAYPLFQVEILILLHPSSVIAPRTTRTNIDFAPSEPLNRGPSFAAKIAFFRSRQNLSVGLLVWWNASLHMASGESPVRTYRFLWCCPFPENVKNAARLWAGLSGEAFAFGLLLQCS